MIFFLSPIILISPMILRAGYQKGCSLKPYKKQAMTIVPLSKTFNCRLLKSESLC